MNSSDLPDVNICLFFLWICWLDKTGSEDVASGSGKMCIFPIFRHYNDQRINRLINDTAHQLIMEIIVSCCSNSFMDF